MKLWRLTREPYVALDGSGPIKFGGRYSSPGRAVVNFASEAALAVLVALRYAQEDKQLMAAEYLLGWTEVDQVPERVSYAFTPDEKKAFVDRWLEERRSLLAAVSSAVLPEADIVLMNPNHPDATLIRPLTVRPFKFSDCLHRPPMLDKYR